MTSIKVKYKNDIRRVTLPEPLSFAKLREIICVLYRSTQLPTNFVVKYVDDENDYISITSDIELEEACACAKRSSSNILRMFISEPNVEGKTEELPLRKDFDVHPQQTTVVTQSQLVSIEQILNSKEVLSRQQQQQHEQEVEQHKQALLEKQRQQEQQQQLEEQRRQAEEQQRFLQQQQQLEQQRIERQRQLEQQQLEQQRLEQQRHLEQQQLEQKRIQQQQQQLEQEQQQRELALQRQAGATEKGQYMAVFVEDVGIQDGAVFAPGVEFEKVWRMKNTGTAPWPVGTQLAFKVGDKLSGATEVFPVTQLAQPGETVNISASLRSPTQPGRYIAYFRLIAPDGSHFGHRIWADIVVEESRMDIDVPTPQQQQQPQPQPSPPPPQQAQPQPPQSPQQRAPFSSPLNAELENAIDQMVSLGFGDRAVNAEALRKASGSLEEAINLLLDGQRFFN